MNSLIVYLIAAIAGAGAIGGVYLKGRADGEDHCEAQAARDTRVAVLASDAAASSAAAAIGAIQIKYTTIRQQAQTEIRHEPVYMDCSHGPDVRRLLDAALTNSAAPAGDTASAGHVPATDAVGR